MTVHKARDADLDSQGTNREVDSRGSHCHLFLRPHQCQASL